METTLAHAGCRADDGSGALVAPIHVATTFERGPGIEYPRGYIYSRISNPGRSLFEVTMAKVEGGVSAAAFGSGMAAIQAVLMAFPQGVVVLPDDLYHGVVTLIEQVLAPWGMRVVRYSADGGTAAISEALDEAIALAGTSKAPAASDSATGTADDTSAASSVLLWMETPSNPLLRIVDIRAACAEARKRGVATAVDATWLTPILCRPIELGADVVVHSVTKYLAGHSDVLAGVVVAAGASAEGTARWHTRADAALDPRASPSQPAAEAGAAAAAEAEAASVDIPSTEKAGDSAAIGWWSRVRSVQRAGGGVAGPFECFLALRGLRTLGVRVRQQCHNAMALATALEAHPGVDAVFYPGLESHPQHELAKTALFASTASGDGAQVLFGAMLSVRIAGGEEAALRVASALRVFHTATSLGGTESLVEHRATIEPAGTKTPRDLLRVSIGLEPASVLVHDWMTALGKERTLG